MNFSKLAENIVGSEIIKIAAEVAEKIKQGDNIYNLTIGDFSPSEFPIPQELKQFIVEEYFNNQTNYPSSEGEYDLRNAVSQLLKLRCDLDYKPNEILIAAGARPLIYSIFRTIVDSEDLVLFPTPSWNNNHYTYLNGAKAVMIETTSKQNFMPTAENFEPYLSSATMIALCSPQNPTGTVFSEQGLIEICNLIIEENKKRGPSRKPLYLIYDQIYWALTQPEITHFNPVSLCPQMKDYTLFVDGISKSLSATGVRVGWCMGPKILIDKMKSILTHIGAWAPKAEQLATAKYLSKLDRYDDFIFSQNQKIKERLQGFYKGIMQLKSEGFNVDAIKPQAAIYLAVQFSLQSKKVSTGKILNSSKEVATYLLNEAKLAIVPFYAFGCSENNDWFRLSIGTCKISDIENVILNLRIALSKLS